MSESPRITVLMPAYNRERYIRDAIESVLAQTRTDFELLIVDDGSTDGTAARVASYRDPRIRLLRNPQNLGIPATRNRGISEARGEFIAMLDSDDIAHPRRLEKQVAFLERRPRHALVGSWFRYIDDEGRPQRIGRRPTGSRRLRARLLFIGCFRNTTVMVRRGALEHFHYREEYQVCEDLDLWTRVSLAHESANLPEILTSYRLHDDAITSQRREQIRQMKMKITSYQLEQLGVPHRARDLELHVALRRPKRLKATAEVLDWAERWLEELRVANQRRRVYPEPQFGLAVGERWDLLIRHSVEAGLAARGRLSRSPLASSARASRVAKRMGLF
jgi:glycosyltransferase involved in cell wall biosynthesis